MKVALVGLGMGSGDTLSQGAGRALARADLVIGARRLLAGLPEGVTANRLAMVRAEEILACIKRQEPGTRICVVYSGDLGFYSGAKTLRPLLAAAGIREESFCGVTTVQYLAARLGQPWQDLHLVSAHGGPCDVLAHVLNHEKCFFLTGGEITPGGICRELTAAGLGDSRITIGERLSYADERIVSGTAAELAEQDFNVLSAIVVFRTKTAFCRESRGQGIPDEEFIRGQVPMTKREVRCQILSLLELKEDDLVWDVGAGTGSVAVEMALCARWGRVFAIEENPEACRLIQANREKFGAYHLFCVTGSAPAALAQLPAPAAVFVGGSKGRMKEILEQALTKNPQVRVVVSAVTLETLQAAAAALQELGFRQLQILQLAVSRAEKLGQGHYLKSLNPIFLLSGVGGHA